MQQRQAAKKQRQATTEVAPTQNPRGLSAALWINIICYVDFECLTLVMPRINRLLRDSFKPDTIWKERLSVHYPDVLAETEQQPSTTSKYLDRFKTEWKNENLRNVVYRATTAEEKQIKTRRRQLLTATKEQNLFAIKKMEFDIEDVSEIKTSGAFVNENEQVFSGSISARARRNRDQSTLDFFYNHTVTPKLKQTSYIYELLLVEFNQLTVAKAIPTLKLEWVLPIASRIGNIDFVAYSLQKASYIFNAAMSLSRAIKGGFAEIIELLLRHGTKITSHTLKETIENKPFNAPIFLRLLEQPEAKEFLTKIQGNFVLNDAINAKLPTFVITALLNKGTPIEAKDPYFYPPLITAARSLNLDIVKILLENKADVNAQRNGRSALTEVIKEISGDCKIDQVEKATQIIKLFLEHKADTSIINEEELNRCPDAIRDLITQHRATLASAAESKAVTTESLRPR